MKCDVTVIAKDEDRTLRQKFQCYADSDGVISASPDCERLKELVELAITNFNGDPSDVIVKIEMIWK